MNLQAQIEFMERLTDDFLRKPLNETEEADLSRRAKAKACFDVMMNLRLLQEIVNTAKGIK